MLSKRGRMVVLGFLHVLAQSEAGNALERQVRRQILKACKTDEPHQTVLDAPTSVLDGWQNRSAMEGRESKGSDSIDIWFSGIVVAWLVFRASSSPANRSM